MAKHSNTRWDSGDTFFLTNQLQSVDPTVFYHLVPGLIGRRAIPPIENVSPNMPVYKFKMLKMLGVAKKGSGHSKGQSSVAVVRTEETQAIKTLEASAEWSIDEVRAARDAGEDLPQQALLDCVTQIEQQIDTMLAVGDTLSGIPGLANNANVATTNAAGVWSAATPDAILGDIANTIDATEQALKQGQAPGAPQMPMFNQWVLFLPNKYKTKLKTTRLGSTNDVTLAYFIKQNFDMIKDIVFWWRLDTANGGTLPMGVLAPALDSGAMNPYAGGALLPLNFEQLPEQYEGRDVVVPCAGKCGGVVMRHPVGFRYLKLI